MAEQSIAERLRERERENQIADALERKYGKRPKQPFTLDALAADEITRLTEELDAARGALEPFALAWDVATRNDAVFLKLSMGQIGALAAHEVSGVHFRNARAVTALNKDTANG